MDGLNPAAALPKSFYQSDPVSCARDLIGCVLVWDGCAGVIVETEAYAAVNDEACHTWTRPSARAFVANHAAGAAYVYFNYGMYWMLNVLIKGGREDGFVLFRALAPTQGLVEMEQRRASARRKSPLRETDLCSGPGKLAQALAVTGADHGRDFCGGGGAGIFPGAAGVKVVSDVRVGISKAQELPWRFVLAESAHISVPVKFPFRRRDACANGLLCVLKRTSGSM